MSVDALSVVFSPLLPWSVLAVLGALGLALVAAGAVRRARGTAFRLLSLAAVWLALANPSLIHEKREARKDIGLVVVDDSPSQSIGNRRAQTAAALAKLEAAAKAMPDLELRVVHAGNEASNALGDEGTKLFEALDRAMNDIPRRRFAGAVFITDGQVHDVPPNQADGKPAALPGPLHALLTGHRGEVDRRLVVVRAPTFGLVEKTATITFRVEDNGAQSGQTARVTVRRDGQEQAQLQVPANQDAQVEIPIKHGGQTVVELATDPGPKPLTLLNKRAVVAINGIRDRLRVLLISGEPSAGERTWRNLLKVDPSVDLVHFTILRPPEKQDNTPINELSLIAFPVRELFEVKLNEFDLIIFDRYRRRNILPRIYLQAVARYVENGGAVLEAAGPTFASPLSLFNSPLGDVLPAEPTGQVFEQPFRPRVNGLGRRHPVTSGLEGAGATVDAEPTWGHWMRQIEVSPRRGEVLMTGVNGSPLLILDRVGEGRIAQLASDHIWLWSRGYEGGGPQAELLRRLAHWLMKEPALEEEDLKAEFKAGQLQVTRRSLTPGDAQVTVTDPFDETATLKLTDSPDGKATGAVPVTKPGLYRVSDGQRTALAAVGTVNPLEFSDVRATADKLGPIVGASGGGVFWIETGDGPDIRRSRADRPAWGRDWLGFAERHDYDVTGVEQIPLLPVVLVLFLAFGGLMLAWQRESR